MISSKPELNQLLCMVNLNFVLHNSCIFLYLSRAFDAKKQGFLSAKDFLLGIAAMQPCTPHGGIPAEMRCRYIFRFYDVNSDGVLEFTEFK